MMTTIISSFRVADKFWSVNASFRKKFKPGPAEPDTPHLFGNSADPHQLASEKANWSGSALFAIWYANLYQQPVSSNLIAWQ